MSKVKAMAEPVLPAPPPPTTPSSTAPATSPSAPPPPAAATPSSGTEVPGGADMTAAKATTTTVPSDKRRRAPRKKKGPAAAAASAVPERKLTHLVIDSGAIIKGAGMTLASAAENFWTVPEVVAEIRDKKARHHLESLPFELKLREPSDEAIKFAAGFARQTGDLRSLSRVDLRVIALTYMLERQETGASHLRTTPVRAGTKVNSKSNGIAAPALVPESEENHAKVSGTPRAAAGVDASSSRNPGEAKGAVEKVVDADVEALCSVMKTAWTKEVVADEGAGKGASEAGCGTLETKQDCGDDARATVISGAVVSDQDGESDVGEDGQETSDEEEGGDEEEEEGGSDRDDDDDDEWEPESNKAEDVKPQSADAAGAGIAAAVGGTAEFTVDDFPTLGGSAAPKPAATPAPTPVAAPSSVVTPSEASSWSLMARSNPAPFQIPVKADPTPLPAAAPVEPETAAGHFGKGGVAAAAGATPTDAPRPDGAKVGTSRILSTAAGFGVFGGGADDDDGEGWVNPSNIKSHKAAGIGLNGPSQSLKKGGRGAGGAATVASKCHAGCVTTDFAMQNVILQVGLPLLSLDGMAVRRVKQWILRCAACFKTCTEMGRLFCPVCGNASLDRVSCSVNAKTGATYLHLRKNHKVNLRGSKFSIPAPNPTKGRFEGDLLLREDQLLSGIWAQKTRRKEKDVSSMFGEDITGNVGMTVSRSADIVVGYGRKNPNSARGRERRGKKGVKKRV